MMIAEFTGWPAGCGRLDGMRLDIDRARPFYQFPYFDGEYHALRFRYAGPTAARDAILYEFVEKVPFPPVFESCGPPLPRAGTSKDAHSEEVGVMRRVLLALAVLLFVAVVAVLLLSAGEPGGPVVVP